MKQVSGGHPGGRHGGVESSVTGKPGTAKVVVRIGWECGIDPMEDGASDASEGLGHEEGDATTKGRQDIAVATRNAGDAVAAALGHESFAVTAGHYAKPEAVASARTHQIEENLDLRKFRGSSAPKKDAA